MVQSFFRRDQFKKTFWLGDKLRMGVALKIEGISGQPQGRRMGHILTQSPTVAAFGIFNFVYAKAVVQTSIGA